MHLIMLAIVVASDICSTVVTEHIIPCALAICNDVLVYQAGISLLKTIKIVLKITN